MHEVKTARARLYEKVEGYKPCEWMLVIDGPFSDFDKARVEAIAEHLRRILEDARVTIKKVSPGSVVLVVSSSEKALELLSRLFARGEQKELLGYPIRGIKRLDEGAFTQFFKENWDNAALMADGATRGVVTMMFTDIVDSSGVKRAVGDEIYFAALERHNQLVRDCVGPHKGGELKTTGDGFLIAFANPSDAVACAVEIQQKLEASPIKADNTALQVRIGLHTGTPIPYDDPNRDFSGTDVDKAARVESVACGGQVLISEETKTLAKPKELYDWGSWELKGLGPHRIFEVLWPGKVPQRPVGRAGLQPSRFLTRFIGREAEITQIIQAVKEHRLVTLKGLGGIGKSRLADEVAARVSQLFDDGVFWIELAQTQNSEAAVVSELIARLEIKPAEFPDEATALLAMRQNHKALLVLNNFETVMAAAPFVGWLLKQCSGIHCLVTSQKLLDLPAEQQIEILPMDLPAGADSLAQLDSFKLFRDRARLKKQDWDVGSGEAPLVAEILKLSDGIPLCIELAAAWVDRRPLRVLRDGLYQYLQRSEATAEEKRQASIGACLDWSFDLLSPAEQALFPKLSVFSGGLFAEDVGQVCEVENASALLDLLHGCSLVSWVESLGKPRYLMLPTVRQYAYEKLADKEGLRRRHAQHFLELLDRADDQIRGKEQMAGFARISGDLDNIRAGMENARQTGHHQVVVQYSAAFSMYLDRTSRFGEKLTRNQQGLSAAEALSDVHLIAQCQNNLGTAYAGLPTGDRGENLQKAIGYYQAALRVYTERDFPVDWAMTQNNLGNAYAGLPTGDRAENLQKAIGCYQAALRVYMERVFPVDWAGTQNNLGAAYRNLPTGDRAENLQKAIGCYQAALRVYTERDFPVDWAMTQNNLGNAYLELPTGDRGENLQKAIGCFEAAIRGFAAAGLTNETDKIKRFLASLRPR